MLDALVAWGNEVDNVVYVLDQCLTTLTLGGIKANMGREGLSNLLHMVMPQTAKYCIKTSIIGVNKRRFDLP